jgi:hypothetical protein
MNKVIQEIYKKCFFHFEYYESDRNRPGTHGFNPFARENNDGCFRKAYALACHPEIEEIKEDRSDSYSYN